MSDSFITHKNQLCDFKKAKNMGIAAYQAELNSKVEALRHLLENYDDGRRKSFFCTAVNLLELQDVCTIIEQLADKHQTDAPIKEKAALAVRLFTTMAEQRSISLTLRKKNKEHI